MPLTAKTLITTSLRTIGAAFVVGLFTTTTHAEQVQFIADTGASNRIVAGDLLRTLSQEIPAAVCHLHNGVEVGEALHQTYSQRVIH